MEVGEVMIEPAGDEVEILDLVNRARSGDSESFDLIMIRYQRQVFRTALRILGQTEDAQDAAQEVFLRLYKYLNRFDQTKHLSPWLYRMTVNVCHDIARKRPNTTQLPEEASMMAVRMNDFDLTAEKRMMAECLKTLPEKERSAIVLRDIEGLSTKEVADALGSSETTVRSQICRARIRLKEFRDRFLRRQS